MTRPVRFLLAALSGCLGVLAFPPFYWAWLIVIVWPLLFLSFRGAGFKAGVRLGVVHGLLLYGLGLSWLWGVFGALAIALWFMLALFTGLAGGVIGWASKRHPRAWWLPVYAAAVWSGIEYFRCEWFTLRFPWMTPGLAMGPSWLSPVVGVYGAGFVVVLVAAFMTLCRSRWRFTGVAVLALVMSPVPSPMLEAGRAVPVFLVQSENLDFTSYLNASKASDFHDGIMAWPELSTGFEIKPEDKEWSSLTALASGHTSVLVYGTTKPVRGEKAPRQGSSADQDHYNIARTIDGSGEVGYHVKNRPVHFMNDGVPGSVAVPVKTRFGNIGTPICFDCDFTEITRRMVDAGAEAFVVPSLDAMNWTEREHLQHAELVRHRAAETGRWFAVASSSGRTQIVDPRGKLVESLPLMKDGVLTGTIHLHGNRTPYSLGGWMFPGFVLAGAVLGTIALLLKPKGAAAVEVTPPTAG